MFIAVCFHCMNSHFDSIGDTMIYRMNPPTAAMVFTYSYIHIHRGLLAMVATKMMATRTTTK